MSYFLSEALSLSILVATGISVVRFRATDSAYLPFIILLWISSVNEVISVTLINFGFQTAINNNIYVLLESTLVLWLYRRLGSTLKSRRIFFALLFSFIIFWLVENFIVGKITQIGSYFRIYYSFAIVLLSINSVNHLLFTDSKGLLKSPSFLISICYIIFFTYKILVEAFWVYGLNNTSEFRNSVYTVLVYLNLIVNLTFALVALWIPKKQEFIRLF